MALIYEYSMEGCGTVKTAPFSCSEFSRYFCVGILLFLFFSRTPAVDAGSEVRGLWVVRDSIVSLERVKKVVALADSLHVSVLFVQVRGRGDAYYKSAFVPPPEGYPNIPDSFDPLATIIELAHKRGIEVHAWFNIYLAWSQTDSPVDPKHPVNMHPDWFMVSKTGKNLGRCPGDSIISPTLEGRYLSPGVEAVRLYIVRVISEVVTNYAVDGVHLDYVRYPGRDFDFHSSVRSQFKRRYGIDPLDIVNNGKGIDPDLKFLETWVTHRTRQIDSTVRAISDRIRLVDRHIRLSAAVKPHPDEAMYEFGQNWVGWLDEGIVDFVVTMGYFPENGVFTANIDRALKKVDKKKIIGGIGIYRMDPEKAMQQITSVREAGLLGYCLFSYSTFTENSQYRATFFRELSSENVQPPGEFKPYVRSKK
ncbi:family 10 glycosylhydrolase [bacterium]|nr:family 10 glycosylhydrolase [bacterium]